MDADKNTAPLEKLPKAGAKRLWVRQYDDLENEQQDWVAQEVPVALVYNGIAHVVMMATPKALPEFAMGFSLAEGIISSPQEIYGMDVVSVDNGIEVHVELATRRFSELKERRRSMAGRTGCGVCGTEQLAEVLRPIPTLPFTQRFDLASLDKALPQLRDVQAVGQLTGCTHAAGWIDTQGTMLGGYEDIGRHVALDKLLGARSTRNWRNGAVLVSSRASYEMVQKSAMCGVEILFAVSAATTLAIEVAQRCNLTLVGFSKPGRATVYSHPERVMP